MTVEMHKGDSFYLGKFIDGPHEAICPMMHDSFVYHITHPGDEKSTVLICTTCSDAFEKDEKAYRKGNA